jgi:hypothetical protein
LQEYYNHLTLPIVHKEINDVNSFSHLFVDGSAFHSSTPELRFCAGAGVRGETGD